MTAHLVVVGVDPGAAATGVVVRRGAAVAAACLVHRGDALDGYLAEVGAAVLGYRDDHQADMVAVEDTVPPEPHMGLSNPAGIIGAAQVLGAVVALAPGAVLVPPAGWGAPVGSRVELCARYPLELIGPRERKGTGRLRHLRSAWDVAGWAARTHRHAERSR